MSIAQRKHDDYRLPPLYATNQKGKLKIWATGVMNAGKYSIIYTNFGWFNGSIQEHTDVIKSGKNTGKTNATTHFEQAKKEAYSNWESKKKEGYVEEILDAKAGKTDSIIAGGIEPMLAHTYAKSGDKIVYPAYVQPKLDGHRCIAIKSGKEVTLWSRTRKRINSCPHIEKAIAQQFEGIDIVLDGELYNHDYHDNFEVISSAIRQSKPTYESKLVQYHVYDTVMDKDFSKRFTELFSIVLFNNPLVPVTTRIVRDEMEMMDSFASFTENGYEGLIIRNKAGKYENKRSYNLQKVKEFDDAEFKIVGVNEGRGKLQGKLGTFTCITKNGDSFEVKMTGNEDENTKYLNNKKLWEGKMLTVKFQGYTNANLLPRFPIGLRIRKDI